MFVLALCECCIVAEVIRCAHRVNTEPYGVPKPLTNYDGRYMLYVECGEGVTSRRGGEARDAASGGVGRIRNGHAHGLDNPRARVHGDDSLVLVVEELAQIVLLAEHMCDCCILDR